MSPSAAETFTQCLGLKLPFAALGVFLFLWMEASGRAADCLRRVGHLFYLVLLISFSIKPQHSVDWVCLLVPCRPGISL